MNKISYKMAPLLSDQIAKSIRAALNKSKSKFSLDDALKELFNFQPDLKFSLDYMILAEENYWRDNGSQVLFPDNEKVFSQLVNSKYEFGKFVGFDLPFTSFVVSMPNDFIYEGYPVPSFLVTWNDYDDYPGLVQEPFSKKVGLNGFKRSATEIHKKGERSLSICMRYDSSSPESLRTSMLEHQIPEILSSNTPEDYRKILGTYNSGAIKGVVDYDKKDTALTFFAFKLACSIGVYNLATSGTKIKSGFPSSQLPKMTGLINKKEAGINFISGSGNYSEKSLHIRRWHFRQLRDDRYYKGEHKNKEKGSRWSFISETTIGGAIDPYTQDL